MEAKKLFIHKFIQNSKSKKTFLLLHGTGGDEDDLIPLAQMISSDFNILSLRGNVSESSMNRFFRRFADGSFDTPNVVEELNKLKEFLEFSSKKYKFDLESLTILGYSNGANFGLNFMLLNPGIINKAILMHPMITIDLPKDVSLKASNFIITNGKFDQYTTQEDRLNLNDFLRQSGAEVESFEHDGGHEIRQKELDFIKSKLALLG